MEVGSRLNVYCKRVSFLQYYWWISSSKPEDSVHNTGPLGSSDAPAEDLLEASDLGGQPTWLQEQDTRPAQLLAAGPSQSPPGLLLYFLEIPPCPPPPMDSGRELTSCRPGTLHCLAAQRRPPRLPQPLGWEATRAR